MNESVVNCDANTARAVVVRATAGESKGIIGLSRFSATEFPSLISSCLGSLSSACARSFACSVPAAARVCQFHLLLRCLLLHMRMLQPCTVHTIRSRTRYKVPRAQEGSKVRMLVRSKIRVLSQRWSQG